MYDPASVLRWVSLVGQRAIINIVDVKAPVPPQFFADFYVCDPAENIPLLDKGYVASVRSGPDMYFLFVFGRLVWVVTGRGPPIIVSGKEGPFDPTERLFVFRASMGPRGLWELTDCFIWRGANVCHNCIRKRRALCQKFIRFAPVPVTTHPILSGVELARVVEQNSTPLTFYQLLNGAVWNGQFDKHWVWLPPDRISVCLRLVSARHLPSARPVGSDFLEKKYFPRHCVSNHHIRDKLDDLTFRSKGKHLLVVDFMEGEQMFHFCLARVVLTQPDVMDSCTHVMATPFPNGWVISSKASPPVQRLSDSPHSVVGALLSYVAPHLVVLKGKR